MTPVFAIAALSLTGIVISYFATDFLQKRFDATELARIEAAEAEEELQTT